MSDSAEKIDSDLNFKELVTSLDLGVLVIDSDWQIVYHNPSACDYLSTRNAKKEPFWESLDDSFAGSFEEAYKSALLGKQDQLDTTNTRPWNQKINVDVYDNYPLDLLEQKSLSFEFHSAPSTEAYSVSFNLHQKLFLMRIENITDRVQARIKAEKNQEELEKALKNVKKARDANPLTGLPGNVQIQKTIKEFLEDEKEFALIYADLDKFKRFNDRYGFEHGDEAILLVRDILKETAEEIQPGDYFLGHVGGDDFVVILVDENYEEYCKDMIQKFDRRKLQLYPEYENREIETKSDLWKQGRESDDMTISLGVVTTVNNDYESYLEMTEYAADVKSYAKQNRSESNYVIDNSWDEDER